MRKLYFERLNAKIGGMAVLFLLSMILVMQSGCGTTPTQVKSSEYVFYPAPPDEPRFQFLKSYKSSEDIGAKKRSGFAEHVLGSEDTEAAEKVKRAYGIAIRDGKIYVCDVETATVVVFDLVNRVMSRIGVGPAGKLRRPANIYVDEDGKKYVADRGWNRVLIYDSTDAYSGVIGDAEKMGPVDVLVVGNELLTVDFTENHIEIWDKNTLEYKGILGESIGEPLQFARPLSLAVDSQKNLYIVESFGFKVTITDEEGHILRSFGKAGDNPGSFARPKGIAVDKEGRIYVADAAFNNLQVFDNEGNLLTYIGSGGDGPGQLVLPAEVVVDYDNVDLFKEYVHPDYELQFLVLVSSQFGPRSVSVYGFITSKK